MWLKYNQFSKLRGTVLQISRVVILVIAVGIPGTDQSYMIGKNARDRKKITLHCANIMAVNANQIENQRSTNSCKRQRRRQNFLWTDQSRSWHDELQYLNSRHTRNTLTVICYCIQTARRAVHTHTHPFNGHLSRTTRVSRYQKGKPIWISLKQETVSGSGIRWAICKSAPSSSQITTPVPHHSIFHRPDALPAAQPTASKHWRHNVSQNPVNCRNQLYNKSTTDRSNGVLELQLTEL